MTRQEDFDIKLDEVKGILDRIGVLSQDGKKNRITGEYLEYLESRIMILRVSFARLKKERRR